LDHLGRIQIESALARRAAHVEQAPIENWICAQVSNFGDYTPMRMSRCRTSTSGHRQQRPGVGLRRARRHGDRPAIANASSCGGRPGASLADHGEAVKAAIKA